MSAEKCQTFANLKGVIELAAMGNHLDHPLH